MVFTLLGATAVAAGSAALNQWLEVEQDSKMKRTRHRPLPAGRMGAWQALGLGLSLSALGEAFLFWRVNDLTAYLGLAALISYVAVYTPLKKITSLSTLVGAVPGALPPLMGWTAVTGRLDAPGLALFSILFLWQIPHFLAIATYRAADYARAGFKVLPLAISTRATRATIVLFSIGLVAATITLEPLRVAGFGYLTCAAVLGAVFIGWAAAGFRRAAANAWARSLFFYSIVYLTLLFVALVIDRTIA